MLVEYAWVAEAVAGFVAAVWASMGDWDLLAAVKFEFLFDEAEVFAAGFAGEDFFCDFFWNVFDVVWNFVCLGLWWGFVFWFPIEAFFFCLFFG